MSISSDLQAEASPADICLEEARLAQAIIDDATVADQKLQADASRLFSPSGDNFSIALLLEGSQGSEVKIHHIEGAINALPAQLTEEIHRAKATFYIIQQDFSWSPFRITYSAFRDILNRSHVSAPFLSFVHAFGSKTSEDEEVRDGYYSRIFHDSRTLDRSRGFEFCYNFRYVEENGRDNGDPWSIRQTGIYQSYDRETEKSTWIILQPSFFIRSNLKTILQTQSKARGMSSNPFMILHAYFLSCGQQNWKAYVEHLRTRYEEIDEKACFSSIGQPAVHDYHIGFSDIQQLHLLSKKFGRILVALESIIDIVAGYESLCQQLFPVKTRPQPRLEMLLVQTQAQKRKVTSCMHGLRGAAELLSKALEFRNHEAIARTSRAMQDNLTTLRDISSKSQQDQEVLRQLALWNRQDSKSIRALTSIATMYLPASLLAQIFCSNLVQLQNPTAESSTSTSNHFALASQFWIFCLVSILITALTWVMKVLLERYL